MKKILNFILFNLGLTLPLKGGEILHLKKERLIELNKDFRDSINFLKTKQQQLMEERSNKISTYQDTVGEIERRKNTSEKDKEEIKKLETEIENFVLLQNEEMQKIAVVFYNKIDSDIKEAVKKFVSSPVLETNFVLYGGKEITKEVNEILNKKDVKNINTSFNSKIYSFDNNDFNNKYKGSKDIQKYIDQKVEDIKKKQKEFLEKMKEDKTFNQEEASKILKAMQNDLYTTQQIMLEKLLNDVENALERIANTRKIDLVMSNQGIYFDAPSIVDEVIKELDKNNEENNEEIEKIKNNNSLIGFVRYENILNKYKKSEENKKKLEDKRKEFENILQEKANQIQKIKDSEIKSKENEIEKLENEYDHLRNLKYHQFQQAVKESEIEIINDIKSASKIIGSKKNLELVVIKSKNHAEVLYAGQDITRDVLNILLGR